VRPSRWFGNFAQQTFERVVVNGVLVGGSTGVVRSGSSAVRAAQTGFLRYYAALLVLGMVATVFYFLVAA
jgi:NADH-quinone oxidoreductase subunit L